MDTVILYTVAWRESGLPEAITRDFTSQNEAWKFREKLEAQPYTYGVRVSSITVGDSY